MNEPDGTPLQTDEPLLPCFKAKAQMRALSMGLTYSEPLGPH